MLFRLLVFLYPVMPILGPPLAALLFVVGLSLMGYALFRGEGAWIWLAVAGCLLLSVLLALFCRSYQWWLFKLRPRDHWSIPFK